MDHAEDLLYSPQSEPALFRYLLPTCLWAWKESLERYPAEEYGAFAMNLSLVLMRDRWRAGTSAGEIDALRRHVAAAILDVIDRQNCLRFDGVNHSCVGWMDAVGTYAIAFDDLGRLWDAWWRIETTGRAVAVLQYASCLIYGRDENPVFAAFTEEKGGGPPSLWECTAILMEDGWRPENARFLQTTLTPDYLRAALDRANIALGGHAGEALARRMAADMEDRLDLLSARLDCLSLLVAKGEISPLDWPSSR